MFRVVSKGILMEGFSVILFIILVNVSLLLFNEIVALEKLVPGKHETIQTNPLLVVKNFNL